MNSSTIKLSSFQLSQANPAITLEADPSLRLSSQNGNLPVSDLGGLRDAVTAGRLWVCRTGPCSLNMEVIANSASLRLLEQSWDDVAHAIEKMPLWCRLGLNLRLCQRRDDSGAAVRSQTLRFSLYSSDISASHICPPSVSSASCDEIHMSLHLSLGLKSRRRNSANIQPVQGTLQGYQCWGPDNDLNLPFKRFSQNYIPSRSCATRRSKRIINSTNVPFRTPTAILHAENMSAAGVVALLQEGLNVLFYRQTPCNIRASNVKDTVPLIKLLPGAFNTTYITRLTAGLDSMNTISKVMCYFTSSGSEGLKAAIRTWASDESDTVTTAISKKLWATLQSQTKVPRSSRSANPAFTTTTNTLIRQDWPNIDTVRETDDDMNSSSCAIRRSLSDIEIDIDDAIELSPVSTQFMPLSSDSGYEDEYSLAPDVDGELFLDLDNDQQERDFLDIDVNADFGDFLSSTSRKATNCDVSQGFEDIDVTDIWEDNCGFEDSDDDVIEGFLSSGEANTSLFLDGIDGGFLEDEDI
ncbi:uncharacterized protein BROUX77_002275 [Berkeleyomyces rouxiae]|uniref:uncharacterized protein n=1 Tax=Berkeleyomyces rouxiae TaxID=2035830 RepID=UPI003B82439C